MAQIDEAVIQLSGINGLPGTITMYSEHGSFGVADAIQTMLGAWVNDFPNGMKIQVPSSGFVLESTNGHQVDVWTDTTKTALFGTDSTAYAGGSGACLSWYTATLVPGVRGPRILRGRTFLVPLGGAAYEANGTLRTAVYTDLLAKANTFLSTVSPHFLIWKRPTGPGATDGEAHPVVSVRLTDQAAVLRSRRN